MTGCSSGIGLACAHVLRQRGHRVIASARRQWDVAQLKGEGFDAVQLDLDSSASIAQGMEQTLAQTSGRLDAVIHNAGFGQPGAVEDLPRQALREQFETNLFGPIELTRHVMPVMRAQGAGRIVFVSSVLGFAAMPWRGAYNSSKFALEGMADTLRLELRGSGILVSLIEPGPITSRFRAHSLEKLRAHIDIEASVHLDKYEAVLNRLGGLAPTPFTLPPEAVATKVAHAIESRRPRIRYRVTVPTHLFAWLKRGLPERWLDPLLALAGKSEGRTGKNGS